jgi:hypothetical protein
MREGVRSKLVVLAVTAVAFAVGASAAAGAPSDTENQATL